MRALIINRKQDSTRLDFQLQQHRLLGVESERVEAECVKVLSREKMDSLRDNWQRALRDTEVACLLSHHKCWGIIAERNEPYLILEDDAVMCNQIAEVLAELDSAQGYDLISLEVRRRKKFLTKQGKELTDGYSLHSMLYDKGGAAGYIVWPSGAKKLLAHMQQHGAAPADAFLGDCRNLKRGQVVPAPIIQLDMCDHYKVEQFSSGLSTIFTNIERPKAENFGAYLKFKLRRCLGQLELFGRVQLLGRILPQYKEVEIEIRNPDFVREG